MNELDAVAAGSVAALRAALEFQEATLLAVLRRLDQLRNASGGEPASGAWCGTARTAYAGAADRLRRELSLAGELVGTARRHTRTALDDLSRTAG